MRIKKLQNAGSIPKIGKRISSVLKKAYKTPVVKELETPPVPSMSKLLEVKEPLRIPYTEPFPFTLVHRTSNIGPIEGGNFVFGDPITGHNMPAIHFSQQTPVVGHSGGSGGAETTTIMLPYRNMRAKVAPVSIEPMDTIFPNYNGLRISTNGAKILTGDRKAYDYYKNNGLDVTFSPDVEKIRMEYLPIQKTGDRLGESLSHKEYDDLRDQVGKTRQKILKVGETLHKHFVENNLEAVPTGKDMERLINIENGGYAGTITKGPDSYGDPLTKRLGYHGFYAPTIDQGLRDQAKTLKNRPDIKLYGIKTPEQLRYVEGMADHGDDFRKLPEEIILPYHYEAPLVKWVDTSKFDSIKEATKRLLEDRHPFNGEVVPPPEPLDFDTFMKSMPQVIDLSQYLNE